MNLHKNKTTTTKLTSFLGTQHIYIDLGGRLCVIENDINISSSVTEQQENK